MAQEYVSLVWGMDDVSKKHVTICRGWQVIDEGADLHRHQPIAGIDGVAAKYGVTIEPLPA